MPLAFESHSHGRIAFGYFNIDTDLLLLENLFFFTPEFCELLTAMHSDRRHSRTWALPGFRIEARDAIGDLMGAIHGLRFTGFIGEVYKLFPFPERNEDFKQDPEGKHNRPEIEKLLAERAQATEIIVRRQVTKQRVRIWIDELVFSSQVFAQLVDYVIRGGYPRWRDERPPSEVAAMQTPGP